MKRFLAVAAVVCGHGLAPHAQARTLDFLRPLNIGLLKPHDWSPGQMLAQAMVDELLMQYRPDMPVARWLAESRTGFEAGKTFVLAGQYGALSRSESYSAAKACHGVSPCRSVG